MSNFWLVVIVALIVGYVLRPYFPQPAQWVGL